MRQSRIFLCLAFDQPDNFTKFVSRRMERGRVCGLCINTLGQYVLIINGRLNNYLQYFHLPVFPLTV
jgi:hypothetical protein